MNTQEERIEASFDVAPVWAGHPVRFALLTHDDWQFVAYFDPERRMTVASRNLTETTWRFVQLPSVTDWDSHKYIDMAVDDHGHLHLSGNMHADPLIYFRTARPFDVDSFERITDMVGRDEQRCTYPQFLRGTEGALIFTYRDGSSGNGNQVINTYDAQSLVWRRLIVDSLIDGEGERNAYFDALNPFHLGPDGRFHLCWVWRETPDCATNHSPSYARSNDLAHWKRSDGTPLTLPITLETGEIVDPVPVHGGIINGNVKMGFDTAARPIVSYHKFDEAGKTQVCNTRREENGWHIYRTSDWDYRWEFGGVGSIPFEVHIGPVEVEPDGRLVQSYQHVQHGTGTWVLDEATLKPVDEDIERPAYPPELGELQTDVPGMSVNFTDDLGRSGEPGTRYVLRWETLGANRDLPRQDSIPPPTMLKLYKLRAVSTSAERQHDRVNKSHHA